MSTVSDKKGPKVTPVLNGPHYTVEEAAKVLGCHPRSAWRYAKDGRLKSVKVSGRFFIPVGVPEKFDLPPHGNPNLGAMVQERFRMAKEFEKNQSMVKAQKKGGCKGGKGK